MKEYGIVPWHLLLLKRHLTEAFIEKDYEAIIRISTDMGHYAADANVPLHTTENYNGQLSGQHGIHGFWESRLPELFFESYNLFTGPASYLPNPRTSIWQNVKKAHLAVDSVLGFEKELNARTKENKKFAFEQRGKITVRTYSKEYSENYHKMLNGMVERQMKRAIKLLGDLWYTSWVDAGQPVLLPITEYEIPDSTAMTKNNVELILRPHE